MRVLAFARGSDDRDLSRGYTFLGFAALADPPRPAAADAIARAHDAGVRVVMLTGDQVETARAIARELRLSGDREPVVIHARGLADRSEADVTRFAHETDVFARITPEDKLRIVEALRQAGEIVAVTGDGVNDAPALRRADIGVAMRKSDTDAAKQTADIVLTDDNLGTIVAAIEEGRTIYANIVKFVHLPDCRYSLRHSLHWHAYSGSHRSNPAISLSSRPALSSRSRWSRRRRSSPAPSWITAWRERRRRAGRNRRTVALMVFFAGAELIGITRCRRDASARPPTGTRWTASHCRR